MAITAATSGEALIALVNTDNTTTYTAADLDLAAPTVVASPVAGRNTSVVVTGKPAAGKSGTVTVDYHRLVAGTEVITSATQSYSGAATVEGAKAAFLAFLRASFPVADSEVSVVAGGSANEFLATVDFATNYVAVGTVSVTLTAQEDISESITTTSLSGFSESDVE